MNEKEEGLSTPLADRGSEVRVFDVVHVPPDERVGDEQRR